jgi:hypothetical protein
MDILRRKWIADLRSGRFKQGVGCLRTEDDEYCCLGVAIPDDMVGVVQFCRYYYNGYAAELPPSVAEALGIDATLMEKLITMNDGDGKSFSQIADYLEELWNLRME